ncbi:DNA-binding MarR family transcriptional regulator [Variovorax boronicumulans]|jgi:DNA-binding MarR family transcriptional regulator|uniref:DNA-binding MarR family transcriptional regulator n=2 Tax=Variovorax TaxID=34072 RepID=A0AAW8CY59_9BURK|nr:MULTISPECIES: MarR family transcriptional regulator [Variovorax]ADU37652.1 regulatory protein MarR [Variovorax paradoxus EPS]MDP9893822.1 DNA-binding MarR family transcriptional regulator [Variovorax boronicumulans]MDQ0034830.1 DNA-binding MarR family transcriptional regulator [Variovorax boronicumulans]MDQ0039312.1 DNA-binding MarR family transcriptional regulator [Variovorax boronicumulans]MDQ0053639.1 DNA-binding MarR family transcriptional regulator [Variovorax boronicumulans]
MHAPLELKTDYINVLLDLASERTRDRGSRVYEIEVGLSIRDVRLLRMIGGAPGITMGQLVQTCAIEKTLVSKLVGSLVQRELVQRQIGSEDARQIHLCLTPSGIDLVLQAEPIGREMEARFLDCLTVAEVAALHRILNKIIDAEAGSRDVFEFLLTQLRESKAADSSSTPPSGTSRKK